MLVDRLRRVARGAGAAALQHAGRPDPRHVIYNSFGGRFSDNPRAIYEALARRGGGAGSTWIAASPEFPDGIETVRPYSAGSLRAVARAGHIVSNVPMPDNLRKRRGVRYVQTWHGTPLKRIGFDNERWQRDPAGLRRAARDIARWDFLVSQNPFSTEILRRAFRFEGEILESGYPRNDVLSSPGAGELGRTVRERLGIPADARAVLYAPTWRDTLVDERGRAGFSLALDAGELSRRLGPDHVLLVRLHYTIDAAIADAYGDTVINVSGHPDIRDLYLAADVLITDYSSAMFDFAVTGKPIVLFTYDLREYGDEVRGFYFDLAEQAPGPLCETTDDVAAALLDLDAVAGSYADRYARFRERFCPFDDGHAADRVIDRAGIGGEPAAGINAPASAAPR